MKNKDHASALDTSPNELALEFYPDFRHRALTEREQTVPGKPLTNMENLYNFWAHFLVRNFNFAMYNEFRNLAIKDKALLDWDFGMRNLLKFYDEALLGHRAILDDNIMSHYLEIVQNEDRNQDRPAFKQMKVAWKNGAFNAMNRHKIVKVIDSNLKEELDGR